MTNIKEFLTWIPPIAFPLSHIVQIVRMVSEGKVGGISPITFAGYFFGNMGAFLFSEKYKDPRTLLGFVLTGILEIVIVSLWFHYQGNRMGWIITITVGIIIGIIVLVLILTQKKKLKKIASAAGFFPAVLFPLATVFQIIRIARRRTTVGVSCAGWTLQILANLGAYFLIGKYKNFKNIGAFLGTATLDVVIVIMYWLMGGKMADCVPGFGSIA
jgi:hypothetical protein